MNKTAQPRLLRIALLFSLGALLPTLNLRIGPLSVVATDGDISVHASEFRHNHDEDYHGEDDDHFCGTRSPSHREKVAMHSSFVEWKEHQHAIGRSLQDANYTIPVQFVVMEAADGRGNLTDAQLDELLLAVNTGFEPTPFQFEHIGTQRTQNDTLFKCDPDHEYEWKAAYRVGRKETLNVFICNLFAQGRFGIYGVGDFPGENFTVTDAVILMNPILPKQGVTFGYMEGVFTHEVGHWLGLYHTFEGGCDPESGGDQVADTPAHAKKTAQYADPNFNCWTDLSPEGLLDTCPNNVTNLDPGLDPVSNFLNYIAKRGEGEKGECYSKYGHFTPGQVERMVMMYETFRLPTSSSPSVATPTVGPTLVAPPGVVISLPIDLNTSETESTVTAQPVGHSSSSEPQIDSVKLVVPSPAPESTSTNATSPHEQAITLGPSLSTNNAGMESMESLTPTQAPAAKNIPALQSNGLNPSNVDETEMESLESSSPLSNTSAPSHEPVPGLEPGSSLGTNAGAEASESLFPTKVPAGEIGPTSQGSQHNSSAITQTEEASFEGFPPTRTPSGSISVVLNASGTKSPAFDVPTSIPSRAPEETDSQKLNLPPQGTAEPSQGPVQLALPSSSPISTPSPIVISTTIGPTTEEGELNTIDKSASRRVGVPRLVFVGLVAQYIVSIL